MVANHLEETDAHTAMLYFDYYSKLANQFNMLQDSVRTNLYHGAVTQNPSDFKKKTVMDVGAGSGILSFFAAQAQAEHVYAVEASSVANGIDVLKKHNPLLGACITTINSTVESITDEFLKVDTIISEPIGTFLLNERMIESFLYARDMFLKPNGKLYPNKAKLYIALFSDSTLYQEIQNKVRFWTDRNFLGIDLSSLHSRALNEALVQPVLGRASLVNTGRVRLC